MAAASPDTGVLPLPCKRMLSRVEAAAYCGVSPTTFDKLVSDKLMPAAKRIYARNLWDVRQIDSAIEDLPGGAEDARLETSEDW